MNSSASSRRISLFKALCVSLFATGTTNGFTSQGLTSPVHSTLPTTGSATRDSTNLFEVPIRRLGCTHLRMATSQSQSVNNHEKKYERMSSEEEAELLRQAMEYRRLNKLETELALRSPTRSLPLLSVRAKNAGYGDEIVQYEEALVDGQKARETLVTKNMGLVHYCVNQILSKKKNKRLNSLSYDDLVQEGAIGLARAVDRWNPEIGGRFSTYAVYWVRASVFRCIAERDDILRVPNHVSQAIRDVNKAARRLGIDLDAQDPVMNSSSSSSSYWKEADAAKTIAKEAGLSERNFEEAMKVRKRRYTGGYVAFESWMQNGNDLETDVTVLSEVQNTASLETEHLRVTLSKFLRPKEMEALSWRYGLVDDDDESTSSIESKLNETRKQRANRLASEAEKELFGTSKEKKSKKSTSIPTRGRWGEAMSFNEVGSKMQVSAEYGRRLCHAALAKLQRAAEEGRLEPALLY